MTNPVALLDACVLVPACLRDTLLRFAERPGLYTPVWSSQIMTEMRRTLRTKIGLTEIQCDRLAAQLQRFFPEACVEGYESIVDRLQNDPKDRHVLAAAIHARAQVTVTSNLRHFGPAALQPFGIEAQSPDTFLIGRYHRQPKLAVARILEQAATIDERPSDVLETLGRDAPGFAKLVREALPIRLA